MTKPNIDDFCEDFDGALATLVDQVTAEVDADTAGMNEIQLAEYWLASASKNLAEMQRIDKLNPVPEFLMEQAQDRVGRQQDRVRAVKQARSQAVEDCITVVREYAEEHGARAGYHAVHGTTSKIASRLEALKTADATQKEEG